MQSASDILGSGRVGDSFLSWTTGRLNLTQDNKEVCNYHDVLCSLASSLTVAKIKMAQEITHF